MEMGGIIDVESKDKISSKILHRELYKSPGNEIIVDELHRVGKEFIGRLHAERRGGLHER